VGPGEHGPARLCPARRRTGLAPSKLDGLRVQAAFLRDAEASDELLRDDGSKPLRGPRRAGGDRYVEQIRAIDQLGIDGVDRFEALHAADVEICPVGTGDVREWDLLERDLETERLQLAVVELLLAPEVETLTGGGRRAVALHLGLDLADARRVAERRPVVEKVARAAAEMLESRGGHVARGLARGMRVGVDAGVGREGHGASGGAELRLRQRQKREL